jgi:hypothetical protein
VLRFPAFFDLTKVANREQSMSVTFVQGQIFSTGAHAIAVGLNAVGRLPVSTFYTDLADRYPVFVSEFHRRSRTGDQMPGDMWVWRESSPWLVALIVRETLRSATRLRYVEAAMLNLYKNWEREGLRSLAVMQLADRTEWLAARGILHQYLDTLPLLVQIYEQASILEQ